MGECKPKGGVICSIPQSSVEQNVNVPMQFKKY